MRSLFLVLTCLSLLALFSTGCFTTTTSKNKCGPCPEYAEVLPHMNFRVVDKTTGNDLFFGSSAPYQTNQLVMHHMVNGKPDSAKLAIDTIGHTFYVFVSPNHPIDTVTMNIANLPQDILLFHTGMTGGCCSTLVLNSISYDGNTVYTSTNGPNLVVLQK